MFPPELVSEIEPGTNLLVSGPAMSGKRELLLQLLARGAPDDEGAIVVTSRNPGADVAEEFSSMIDDQDTFFRVIDCLGSESEFDFVHSVSSPGDLTGIGIEFSELAREANEREVDRIRIGFDSLSPLLMYVDLQRLFRFLHVFTSQIQSRDWLGLFAIDPDAHDEQVVNTISQLFDGMIEVRVADEGGREARIRGITSSPTEWVPLD
ncbi:RAD55 family ATPase [Halospeciosus flavus]|uniref:RAD55 family ATPase n=2 Tax=Halospeciosus flavus TaxID=3032283 RepID=A0ABD5Z4Y8_9EURY|nr:recombinase RecA [Halospeciosus flavus]